MKPMIIVIAKENKNDCQVASEYTVPTIMGVSIEALNSISKRPTILCMLIQFIFVTCYAF